jgi:SpoIIAA-like
MLEIIPAPEGVVAMRATGQLDQVDIERAVGSIETALAQHGRIALYAEVGINGMSPGALWKDLTYGFGKLRELHRFPRAAIVSDQGWVRWITQAESVLLPGIEMRVFPEAWLCKNADVSLGGAILCLARLNRPEIPRCMGLKLYR